MPADLATLAPGFELDGEYLIGRDIRPGEDRPLLVLDAAGRWRVAYDTLQFILQKRSSFDRRRGVWNWQGVSFVHHTTVVLLRDIREKGVDVTPEARAALTVLPPTFPEFLTAQKVPARPPEGYESAISPPAGRWGAAEPSRAGNPIPRPGRGDDSVSPGTGGRGVA